jgi:hypothetical protein
MARHQLSLLARGIFARLVRTARLSGFIRLDKLNIFGLRDCSNFNDDTAGNRDDSIFYELRQTLHDVSFLDYDGTTTRPSSQIRRFTERMPATSLVAAPLRHTSHSLSIFTGADAVVQRPLLQVGRGLAAVQKLHPRTPLTLSAIRLELASTVVGGWRRSSGMGATMKSFPLFAALCAIALGAGATRTARGGTITETISFTASDFVTIVGSGSAPVDPVIGSFTITFDPFVATTGTTITLNNINIPLSDNAPFFITRTDTLGPPRGPAYCLLQPLSTKL